MTPFFTCSSVQIENSLWTLVTGWIAWHFEVSSTVVSDNPM